MSPNRKRSRSFADPKSQPDGLTLFRARLRTGDYDAVIGRQLRRALREASAIPDLDAEIGALRLTLIRLLQEESDPSRLASSVARLGAVAAHISRLRRNSHDGHNEIGAYLSHTLAEIDAE
jgi:hypothetical protein